MELESNMLTKPTMAQPYYSLDEETEKTNLHILKAASQHQGRVLVGLLLYSGQMATSSLRSLEDLVKPSCGGSGNSHPIN